MAKKVLINILVLFLLSSTIFLVLKYIYSLRDNIALLENQKQNLLQDIEKERNIIQQIKLKNVSLKSYLTAAHKKVKQLFSNLATKEDKINSLDAQFSILKAENSALLDEKSKIILENEDLKMKLNSLEDLKIAMQKLKDNMPIEGNRGFLIKDGQSTSASKIKIEVTPALGNNNEGSISTASQ